MSTNKKIKIIHFVSGIKSGGVESVLINYGTYLNKCDGFNQFIVYQHNPDVGCLKKINESGYKTFKIPSKSTHPFKNLIQSFKIIKKIKPDIVESHMNLLSFLPLMVAYFCRVPIRISHSHISQNDISVSFLVPFFKMMNIIFATNLFSCGVQAGRYMFGKRNFFVIKNAINFSKFQIKGNRESILKDLGIRKEAKIIGHVGRFVEQKNHERLLDIFKKIIAIDPLFYLILIGDGELKDKILNKAKEIGVYDNVRFLGNVIEPEKYYSCFDVFLFPSLYEGLPLVAIEIQAAGIPSIFSDSIDNDSILLRTTEQLSLEKSDTYWANETIGLSKIHRLDFSQISNSIIDNGFYDKYAANDLRKIYFDLLEGKVVN